MFLAELAYNTVAKEIDELERKKENRKQVLEQSQRELEEDHDDLIKFIHNDTKTKNERDDEEKKQLKIKAEKEDKLKSKENEISSIKSEIEKNKDALQALEKARYDILKIKQDNDSGWYEERFKQQAEKLHKLKTEWINGGIQWIEQRARGG